MKEIVLPGYSLKRISTKANAFLIDVSPTYLNSTHAFDFKMFIEFEMKHKLGVDISIKNEISDHEACYQPKQKRIAINEFTIYYPLLNPQHELHCRARFTMAHEIGHVVLHRQILIKVKPDECVSEKLEEVGSQNSTLYKDPEWQADMFALFMLAPTSFINYIMRYNHYKSNNAIIRVIADQFKVSQEVAERRLEICLKYGV